MPDVRLREWRPSDAPLIAAIADDPHLRRWSSMGDDPGAWIARQRDDPRGPSRAICLADDDAPLGKVALRLPGRASEATMCAAIAASDAPVAELSYWLLPAARGRGIAGAAVRAMLEWTGVHADVRTVVLDVEAANEASCRLAQRLGARRRSPTRTVTDRTGTPRELVVHTLTLAPIVANGR